MKEISEIKTTQIANAERREKFATLCEEKRTEIWVEINKINAQQREWKGMAIGIGLVAGTAGAFLKMILEWFMK